MPLKRQSLKRHKKAPKKVQKSDVGKATPKKTSSARTSGAAQARVLNVRPVGPGLPGQHVIPTLMEVPIRRELSDYQKAAVPILGQARESACTGYGLATVTHYLLRTRKYPSDQTRVSPPMFYDLARRHDEWTGVDYDGSSCRGAMKGWYKHCVCTAEQWHFKSKVPALTEKLAQEAALRPLGAYVRVNHADIVAMHAAITEVGVYASATVVHARRSEVGADGYIQPSCWRSTGGRWTGPAQSDVGSRLGDHRGYHQPTDCSPLSDSEPRGSAVLAMGGGGLAMSPNNDAGYWIFTKLAGLYVADGLRTRTVLLGTLGFCITLLIWPFV